MGSSCAMTGMAGSRFRRPCGNVDSASASVSFCFIFSGIRQPLPVHSRPGPVIRLRMQAEVVEPPDALLFRFFPLSPTVPLGMSNHLPLYCFRETPPG